MVWRDDRDSYDRHHCTNHGRRARLGLVDLDLTVGERGAVQQQRLLYRLAAVKVHDAEAAGAE